MPTSLAEAEICPRLHLWEGRRVWEADLNLICSSPIANSLLKREKKRGEKTHQMHPFTECCMQSKKDFVKS